MTGGGSNAFAIPPDRTLSELGYRMPAEWEPHEATWVSWPHNRDSWPGGDRLERAQTVFANAVAILSRHEPVHVNVNDGATEQFARTSLEEHGPLGEIHFHHFPTNDAWCRDHGAIFVVRDEPRNDGWR